MRLRRRFVRLAAFATASLAACAAPPGTKPAATPPSAPSTAEVTAVSAAAPPPGAGDVAPHTASAREPAWAPLATATLLDRRAPKDARAQAFASFQRDAFDRVAVIVRRADSKGADTVIRGLCTFSYLEGADEPRTESTQGEWALLRALHRKDGDEAGTLALLDLTAPSEAVERERAAVLAWVDGTSERTLVRAGRRARVALERAGACPSAVALTALEGALREHLAAALALRNQQASSAAEGLANDEAREALKAFTLAPLGLVSGRLLQGDLQGAKKLAAEPSIGAFVHPAILEALNRLDATPTATEYAALALTLRIVVERDSRHRDVGLDRLVELASARLAREAQVLQPTAPETTLLAARIFAALGLGALAVPMLDPVAARTAEQDWLREALLIVLGAEGEAAARADRRDVERVLEAGRTVLEAVTKQGVNTSGVEVWRARAMAGEAALRDGDGAAAEAHFRALDPVPSEVAVPLARLEAAGGKAREALARLDAVANSSEGSSAAERAVYACEIAANARLTERDARCSAALDAVLGARALWNDKESGKSDRLLAKLLLRFEGGLEPALAALERAFASTRKANADVSFIVGQAIGAALVADRPEALGRWLERAAELDADDLVYFGAWAEALLQRHAGSNEAFSAQLRRAQPRSTWVKALQTSLAAHAPESLTTLARFGAERAEASFYVGLHAWSQRDDATALVHFARVRDQRALDLMEHGFAEGLLAGKPTLALPKDRVLP